jgi:hypothetical protein
MHSMWTAWAHFAIQAHLRGWITRAIGGLGTEIAGEQAGLPQDFKALATIAVGKQGSTAGLPEFFKTSRSRMEDDPSQIPHSIAISMVDDRYLDLWHGQPASDERGWIGSIITGGNR